MISDGRNLMSNSLTRISVERVEKAILLIRGEKVILDSDLAALYGVTTTRLNEQVRRNHHRFPGDFAFRLTKQEFANLISQIATSSSQHGGRRKPPLVFSEHGAMISCLCSFALKVGMQLLLCATSVFSVSLWLLFRSKTHHRGTENTEVAQRNH